MRNIVELAMSRIKTNIQNWKIPNSRYVILLQILMQYDFLIEELEYLLVFFDITKTLILNKTGNRLCMRGINSNVLISEKERVLIQEAKKCWGDGEKSSVELPKTNSGTLLCNMQNS